jgi:signal transduction histidine kinase
LSANLAHEIRNPIAAMRLKAENALVSQDATRKTGALEAILQQVMRLDGLLRDLLAMTQAGEPRLRPVELAAFLHTTVDSHREVATQRGIRLHADLAPPAPSLCFDPSKVRRALDNLILNAIQHTPRGGEIVVAAGRRNDRLVFRVSDTGDGVSDDIKDRLFEPFVSARADGTGLGLAIVREIARAHHGDAQLGHSPVGASFEIDLPWQPS